MVYNSENCWGSGICPSSGILSTRKYHFGNWIYFLSSGDGRKIPTLIGPLVSLPLNGVSSRGLIVMSSSHHLRKEIDPVSGTVFSTF
jgi:hypothetical protein